MGPQFDKINKNFIKQSACYEVKNLPCPCSNYSKCLIYGPQCRKEVHELIKEDERERVVNKKIPVKIVFELKNYQVRI